MVGFGTKGEVKVQAVTTGADTSAFESDVTKVFKWALEQETKVREGIEVNLEQAVVFLVKWVATQEAQSRKKVDMLEQDADKVFTWATKQTGEVRTDIESLYDYARDSLSIITRAVSAFNTLFQADIETKWLTIGITARAALSEAWILLQQALAHPGGWGMVPYIGMLILSWAEFMAYMIRTQDQIETLAGRSKDAGFEEMIGTIQ